MAQDVLIIGPSGTGKSTSLENLLAEETAIINPAGKPLPFAKYKQRYKVFDPQQQTGNLFNFTKAAEIVATLDYIDKHLPYIKNVIIDDANYIMSFEYIERAKENGFAKFTDIGTNFASIIMRGKKMREDINFIMMMHPEIDTDAFGNKVVKAKTVGVCPL